ncbi:DUF1552 domain-containing protein [Paraliomyxa miuraensis]|uniref:DUF1552 domain-containing protein n=1 Tax=Paraliomyxa miuraensis TaxID=376150 RepID=UPI00224D5EC7|nr:DUF1552 domain-containing protein [Paraliomyxa miuraensis]MCX4243352.1 DUF1552 domain-containing protein [Paraliomyxa miuraensis]
MVLRNRTFRRSFLRGAAGFTLALPLLESMQAKAATGAPQRYFLGFAGSSIGFPGFDYDQLVPDATGAGYDVKRALQPLLDLGIRDSVSVVTGMEIPWGDAGSVPAGGRVRNWHAKSVAPLISGVRGADDGNERAQGATSDQIAADVLGQDTVHRLLAYRVQAAYYRGSNGDGGDRGRISYRDEGGTIVPVDPIVSPRLAYESLFTGFVPPDPAQAAEALAVLRRRRSAVDLVLEDAQTLIPKLGAADRQRLQRHFDELRSLEQRLDQEAPPLEGACELLPHPGDDPAIGGAVENGDTDGYAGGGAYSNEQLRAEILTDLVAMAFTCDLTRVASMMYTMAQCFLNANPLFGQPSDMHELGHFGVGGGQVGLDAMSDGVAWHVAHYGRLVQRLRDIPDLDGSSVLDNSALVLVFEGGWGYDPESGDALSVHSSENMSALIAGHAGGLNPNGGVHVPNPGGHPTQVINTALRAVGVDHEMGEVSGVVGSLLG